MLKTPSNENWFSNCGGWKPRHSLTELQAGIAAGLLNLQDESGSTALSLAAGSGWLDGVEELLLAEADTELRYFRTGETPLLTATQAGHESVVAALLAAGANPDAGNHFGLTPRSWRVSWFEH